MDSEVWTSSLKYAMRVLFLTVLGVTAANFVSVIFNVEFDYG
jgi:hypothetical protein